MPVVKHERQFVFERMCVYLCVCVCVCARVCVYVCVCVSVCARAHITIFIDIVPTLCTSRRIINMQSMPEVVANK